MSAIYAIANSPEHGMASTCSELECSTPAPYIVRAEGGPMHAACAAHVPAVRQHLEDIMGGPTLPAPAGGYSDSPEWLAQLNRQRHGVPYTIRVCDFCPPADLMSHDVRTYMQHVNSGFYMSACANHGEALNAAWEDHRSRYAARFACCESDR